MTTQLTETEKKLLFWASFLSLAAAGFGFAFRVAMGGNYSGELGLSGHEQGMIFGASLWPIALTMIGFSLVVDKTGYKIPMFAAFVLQGISAVGTFMADSYVTLYGFALCAGLAHGIIEAVINPACAAVYPNQKTKMLTILHASWPAGLVFGTLIIIGADSAGADPIHWRYHALWMLIPAVAYAIMYLPCRFPVDERVQAGVPYIEMLKQVGFLSAALAAFMMVYEIGNQGFLISGIEAAAEGTEPTLTQKVLANWFLISLGIGLVIGGAFGAVVKSIGKPLFFLMCLLMIPVATAELGTDGWIQDLMKPVLTESGLNAAFAIVFSASIMLLLRVFAGGILKFFSPPTLLGISGLFSAIGLYWLSTATSFAIFFAFVLYAVGQTYYWPCILGFVSERYPRGGALTLNTVSAIGLLSLGIIGMPILGVASDEFIEKDANTQLPEVAEASRAQKAFLWMDYEALDPGEKDAFLAKQLTPQADALLAELKSVDAVKHDAALKDMEDKSHAEQAYALLTGIQSMKDRDKIVSGLSVTDQENVDAVLTQVDQYGAIKVESGRKTLVFAAIFPGILVIAFGAIALWFKMQGGYKPIHLESVESALKSDGAKEAVEM